MLVRNQIGFVNKFKELKEFMISKVNEGDNKIILNLSFLMKC